MSERPTQASHHLNPAVRESMEVETVTLVSSSQIERRNEGIQEARHKDTERIATGPNNKSKDSSRRNTFASTRPDSEKGAGTGKRHPGFSTAQCDLEAVQRPLQATRCAPTIRSALQELTVRQRPLDAMLGDETECTIRTIANSRSNVEDFTALAYHRSSS